MVKLSILHQLCTLTLQKELRSLIRPQCSSNGEVFLCTLFTRNTVPNCSLIWNGIAYFVGYCNSGGTQVNDHKTHFWAFLAKANCSSHWPAKRNFNNWGPNSSKIKIYDSWVSFIQEEHHRKKEKAGAVHMKHKLACCVRFCKVGFLRWLHAQGEARFKNNSKRGETLLEKSPKFGQFRRSASNSLLSELMIENYFITTCPEVIRYGKGPPFPIKHLKNCAVLWDCMPVSYICGTCRIFQISRNLEQPVSSLRCYAFA